MSEKFWMVFVEGANTPATKHYSMPEARQEAERLAAKFLEPVYILEAIWVGNMKAIEWREL